MKHDRRRGGNNTASLDSTLQNHSHTLSNSASHFCTYPNLLSSPALQLRWEARRRETSAKHQQRKVAIGHSLWRRRSLGGSLGSNPCNPNFTHYNQKLSVWLMCRFKRDLATLFCLLGSLCKDLACIRPSLLHHNFHHKASRPRQPMQQDLGKWSKGRPENSHRREALPSAHAHSTIWHFLASDQGKGEKRVHIIEHIRETTRIHFISHMYTFTS